MSRIYFHTQHEGTREVLGTERARMGIMCTDIAMALIPRWPDHVRPHLNPEISELIRERFFINDLRTMISAGETPVFMYNGKLLSNLSLVLNTVLVVGNDPLCLYARLHGQCEIHAYVEGPNRAWLADVIRDGLECGVYRPEAGWKSVVTLLRNRDDEPVVTSYSICESFPNRDVTDWVPPGEANEDDDAHEDAWYDLDADERWRLAMTALRVDTESLRELQPENLRGLFRHEKTMFDLFSGHPRPKKHEVT